VTESTSLLYPPRVQQEQLQHQQQQQYQQQLPASPLNHTSYLLPPMNGSVDYSNLKTTSLPNSLQNSRRSPAGGLAHNFGAVVGVGVNGTLHYSQHGAGTGTGIDTGARPPMLLERNDSFFKPLSRRASSSFFEPFNDHTGAAKSVVAGLFNLTVIGIIIGLIMPKNERLPTPWYRILSSIIGYTYFIFWCSSFYPQIVMNFQRKSTEGLSIDYSVINFLGYICYTAYTSAFYWNSQVKEMYRQRHFNDNPDGPPAEITVESNDVAFTIHALIMSIIWLFQLQIYGGFEKCRKEGKPIISRPIFILMTLILSSCSIYGLLIVCSNTQYWSLDDVPYLNWLDYLYYLSFMKVVITASKYIPQALLNMRRKSCVGWNIWNILLDISGGILSLIQLVADAVDLNDLSSIAGNSAKLGLSGVSIFFDIIFLLQHYVWYPEHDDVKKHDDNTHHDDDEDLEYVSSDGEDDDDLEFASSEDESEPFKKGTGGTLRSNKYHMVV